MSLYAIANELVAALDSKSLRKKDQPLYLSRYIESFIPKNTLLLGLGVSEYNDYCSRFINKKEGKL